MKHILKYLIALMPVVLFFSCKKDDINKGIKSTEQTLVRLPQAEEELFTIALNAVPGTVDVKVLEVRKDVKSEGDLNTRTVVKIAPNNSAIAAYNAAHQTELELFTQYTLNPATPFDGTHWTVTFNPGEFVKYITISLNPANLDLTKRNAMAFKIASAEGGNVSISKAADSALVEIAIKNKYDGVYRVTGTMVDNVVPTLTGYFPMDVDFITAGPNTVMMVPHELGIPGHLILNGSSLSYYGSFAPVFHFDPATDRVVNVTNSYGQPAGNGRSAALDATGINQWNATDKSMQVKYLMLQPGTTVRTVFNEQFEYLGPR
jgi:hypothetical protein